MMANWRMFSKDVVETDNFLAMPLTSHALYFHLCMEADDDGFVSNPKRIMRSIGSNEDDIKVLISKGYVIDADEGIIVITHWNMSNHIRKDRKKNTIYLHQKNKLYLVNGIYILKSSISDNQLTTMCQPNDNQLTTQNSIEEFSVDKDSTVVDGQGNLEQLVRKHFENALLDSEEFKVACEVKEMNEFIEIMNTLTSLAIKQNEIKLKKCLDLKPHQIIELYNEASKAKDDIYRSFNNPNGWIVSRINKIIKGEQNEHY